MMKPFYIFSMIMFALVGCNQHKPASSVEKGVDTMAVGDTGEKMDGVVAKTKEADTLYNKYHTSKDTFTYQDYTFIFCWGYLEVFYKTEKIFSDTLKDWPGNYDRWGQLKIDILGYHDVQGKKLFFDYNYEENYGDCRGGNDFHILYSIIDSKYIEQIIKLNGFWGERGSKDHKLIFPEDSLGVKNRIIGIENLEFFDEHIYPHGKKVTDKISIRFDKYGKAKVNRTNKIERAFELDTRLVEKYYK